MKLQSRLRTALLQGSMLITPGIILAPAHVAVAQSLPATARPQNGQVVGGAASIAQGISTTTITQSTGRAVIDWRSFDVGRDHTVAFRQPSAASMTLNRVTGPDPSVIAGRITANGGIALVNQSGVVFAGGAQVEAHSVIVSTSDMSNAAFMQGGKMAFDRPGKPGAKIENNGTITARQAGLAALVAPQVANHGVITAQLGTVVLAGAERHVIDLNGDGLVSFDITGAVRGRAGGNAALVTNTGTIRADGGTVLLTAAAADGIVQTLVRAGGTISAATDAATGRQGTVLLTGTGGSIIVEGSIAATGIAPGTTGGAIAAAADRVLVAGTARLDASGSAGGGSIAIGTMGPGARKPHLANRAGIAAGAVLRADATRSGNGGRVVVNAKQATVQAGTITARGGAVGGNGGTVEVSSGGGLQLAGSIDVGAPAGLLGQVVLDPQVLTIVPDSDPRVNVANADIADLILASGDAPINAFLGAGQVGAIAGNLVLQATDAIGVDAGITKPVGGLVFDTGGILTINAPVVLGSGNLTLIGEVIAVNDLVQVGAAFQVLLDHRGSASFANFVTETGIGRITAGTLTQGSLAFDDITLSGANLVTRITRLDANNTVVFNNNQSLQTAGTINGGSGVSIDVQGGDLAVNGAIFAGPADGPPYAAQLRASGNIVVGAGGSVDAAGISLAAAYDFAAGTVDVAGEGGITLTGSLSSRLLGVTAAAIDEPLLLAAGTGGITQIGGQISASNLTVRSGGQALLNAATTPNAISGTLLEVTAAGDFALDNGTTDITVAGQVAAANISLRTAGAIDLTQLCGFGSEVCILVPATLDAGAGRVSLQAGSIVFTDPGNSVTGSVVEIAPTALENLVAGGAATSTVPGALTVNQDVLTRITAQTLRLGATAIAGTTASTVQFAAPVTFANTLDLRSLGSITQADAAPITAGTLTGAAGGAVQLANPANAIGSIGDLSAGGPVDLTVSGQMTLAGLLSAPAQPVTLVATNGIGETGNGAIQAGLLAARTSTGDITLPGANRVDSLGATSTPANLSLNNAASLTVPAGAEALAGGTADIASAGDLVVNGTVRGDRVTLHAAGLVAVNGLSDATGNGPLFLTGDAVAVTGLIASATDIFISANTANLSGRATGDTLSVSAPSIAFGGLAAGGMRVNLLLGSSGTAFGTLDAGALLVAGGRAATLFGTVAGVGGQAAAVLGVRADAAGNVTGNLPPNQNAFTVNGCPIAVQLCGALQTVQVSVATAPLVIIGGMYPRRYSELLTDSWFQRPTPPDIPLSIRPTRDPAEDLDLAPPNIRAEDF